jgi:hypothetical protein
MPITTPTKGEQHLPFFCHYLDNKNSFVNLSRQMLCSNIRRGLKGIVSDYADLLMTRSSIVLTMRTYLPDSSAL